MKNQSTPMAIWNTVCDANVDLFQARMDFSAEMLDRYTKWPRKSFCDMAEAMKAAHLESPKLLAEKPAAKTAEKPAAKKKAKPAPKLASGPAVKAGPKPVTLPDMPDFTAKPRPTPAEAPKPAETPEKDS